MMTKKEKIGSGKFRVAVNSPLAVAKFMAQFYLLEVAKVTAVSSGPDIEHKVFVITLEPEEVGVKMLREILANGRSLELGNRFKETRGVPYAIA